MAALPGRKGLIIVSDGHPLPGPARALANLANRGSVVVYHIDPRGMVPASFSAADADTVFGVPIPPQQLLESSHARGFDVGVSQLGASDLPKQTGGFAIQNSNDFAGAMRRVMDDLRGYYLIAYRPEPGLSDDTDPYHRVSVRVNTPGLHVRSRQGFYSAEMRRLRLKLTPFLWQSANQPLELKAYLHVGVNELSFTEDRTGTRGTKLQVILTAFDRDGNVVHRIEKILTVRAGPAQFESLVQYGFVSTLALPIPALELIMLRPK
jgi:hypothetical protein